MKLSIELSIKGVTGQHRSSVVECHAEKCRNVAVAAINQDHSAKGTGIGLIWSTMHEKGVDEKRAGRTEGRRGIVWL